MKIREANMSKFVLEVKIHRDIYSPACKIFLTISEQTFLCRLPMPHWYLPNIWLTFRLLCHSPSVLHARNTPVHSPLPGYLLFMPHIPSQCRSPVNSFCLVHSIINYSSLCIFLAFCIPHFVSNSAC